MRYRSWLTGQSKRGSNFGEGPLTIWFGAVPTATGSLETKAIPRLERSLALRRDLPAIQQVAAGLTGRPTLPTVRGVATSFGDQGEAHRLGCLQLPDDPVAPAVAARPAAPAPHRELPDQHRI